MNEKIKFFNSPSIIPYDNQAYETYFLNHVSENEVILFLWRNKNTIGVGKNQYIYNACKTDEFKKENGYLARRISGGGTIYNDLGNLNFTFITHKNTYNLDHQMKVIMKSVSKFGLMAFKSGRNDIVVNARKFSGNAYYADGDKMLHHGTMLINADFNLLKKYLIMPEDKLKMRGHNTLDDRICNLSEFNPSITVVKIKENLKMAFGEIYNSEPENISEDTFDMEEVKNYIDKFSSEAWILGSKFESTHSFHKRYDWGDIELLFHVKDGLIQNVEIYTDAIETELPIMLKEKFKETAYQKSVLLDNVRNLKELNSTMKKDILELINTKFT